MELSALQAAILSTAPIKCIKFNDGENPSILDTISILRSWSEYTQELEERARRLER